MRRAPGADTGLPAPVLGDEEVVGVAGGVGAPLHPRALRRAWVERVLGTRVAARPSLYLHPDLSAVSCLPLTGEACPRSESSGEIGDDGLVPADASCLDVVSSRHPTARSRAPRSASSAALAESPPSSTRRDRPSAAARASAAAVGESPPGSPRSDRPSAGATSERATLRGARSWGASTLPSCVAASAALRLASVSNCASSGWVIPAAAYW